MLSRIYDFEIKQLDISSLPLEFHLFTKKCEEQGMKNNISSSAMKIGKWSDDEAWWCTWYKGEIISISGCHRFFNFMPGCWRLMVRTATLNEYRGRAPGSIKDIKTDFNWGHILEHQVAHANSHGASKLVFSTNSDENGDANSYRTNRVVKNVLEPRGLVKLLESNVEIFYTKQNIWEIMLDK